MSEASFSRNKLTFSQIAKTRVFWVLLAVLVVLLLGTIAYVSSVGTAADAETGLKTEVMPVKVAVAEFVDFVVYDREFSGVVRAKRSSDLAFERSARIMKLHFDDGDLVGDNQVIAELDTRDLEHLKNQFRAQVDNANAVLAELNAGPREEVIDSARADVAAFRAELKLATDTMQRRDSLRRNGAISDEEWDQAESNFNARKARLDSAEKKLEELVAGIRKEKKAAQAALVRQLEAQLAQVDLDIDKSKLRAPFTGKIAARFVDEGVIASPGSPIVRLTEHTNLEAAIGLPPALIPSISIDQEFDATSGELSFKARLIRILPETDNATRTVPVIFQIKSSQVKPGQIVRIGVEEKRAVDGVWVPTESLLPATKGLWSVFVVDESAKVAVTKPRTVEVLFSDGGRSLIQGTITGGDKIVREGAQRLSQGQSVRIVE